MGEKIQYEEQLNEIIPAVTSSSPGRWHVASCCVSSPLSSPLFCLSSADLIKKKKILFLVCVCVSVHGGVCRAVGSSHWPSSPGGGAGGAAPGTKKQGHPWSVWSHLERPRGAKSQRQCLCPTGKWKTNSQMKNYRCHIIMLKSYVRIFLYTSLSLQTPNGSDLDCTFPYVERESVHFYGDAGRCGRCSPAHHCPGTRDGSCFIGTLGKYIILCSNCNCSVVSTPDYITIYCLL